MIYRTKLKKKTGTTVKSLVVEKGDAWCIPTTLVPITLALLRELAKHKQGSPFVKNKHVPKVLRSKTSTLEQTCPTHHEKWNWVLCEIVNLFESLHAEYFEQFCPYTDLTEHQSKKYYKRQKKALKLYGVYFLNLWD